MALNNAGICAREEYRIDDRDNTAKAVLIHHCLSLFSASKNDNKTNERTNRFSVYIFCIVHFSPRLFLFHCVYITIFYSFFKGIRAAVRIHVTYVVYFLLKWFGSADFYFLFLLLLLLLVFSMRQPVRVLCTVVTCRYYYACCIVLVLLMPHLRSTFVRITNSLLGRARQFPSEWHREQDWHCE